jgi:hypothetical protein
MKLHNACLASLVSVSMVACGGSSLPGGSSPGANANAPNAIAETTAAATATPAPAPTLPAELVLGQGKTDGKPGMFTPTRGDTATGGQSQVVDNIQCAPTMVDNSFHVHSFVGLIVNGQWYAIPDSIGFYKPGPLESGFSNYATCFYNIHTHDASGYVHQEILSSAKESASLFTLGNFVDVWGQTLSGSGFGPFPGVVEVYTAQAPSGALNASNWTQYTGDPNQIALYSHEAVWIEVGPPYVAAAQLPIVRFYTQY